MGMLPNFSDFSDDHLVGRLQTAEIDAARDGVVLIVLPIPVDLVIPC